MHVGGNVSEEVRNLIADKIADGLAEVVTVCSACNRDQNAGSKKDADEEESKDTDDNTDVNVDVPSNTYGVPSATAPVIELIPVADNDTVVLAMGESEPKVISSSAPLRHGAERVTLDVPLSSDGTIDVRALREVIASHVDSFVERPDAEKGGEADKDEDEDEDFSKQASESFVVEAADPETLGEPRVPVELKSAQLNTAVPTGADGDKPDLQALEELLLHKIRKFVSNRRSRKDDDGQKGQFPSPDVTNALLEGSPDSNSEAGNGKAGLAKPPTNPAITPPFGTTTEAAFATEKEESVPSQPTTTTGAGSAAGVPKTNITIGKEASEKLDSIPDPTDDDTGPKPENKVDSTLPDQAKNNGTSPPVIELIPSPEDGTVTIAMASSEPKVISSSVPLKEGAGKVVLDVPVRQDGTVDLRQLRQEVTSHVRTFVRPDAGPGPGKSGGDRVVLIPDPSENSVTVIVGELETRIQSPLPLRPDAVQLSIPVPSSPDKGGTATDVRALKKIISKKIRGFVAKAGGATSGPGGN